MILHTPTPWHVAKIALTMGDRYLTRIQAVYGNPQMDDSQLAPVMELGQGMNMEANAAFIVRAVNAHAALLAALRAVEWGEDIEGWVICPSCHAQEWQKPGVHAPDCQLASALALARE